MLKIMEGERPIRPRGTQELGLVDPLWGMTINCWQHDPAHRPTTARVVEFLREWSVFLSPHRNYISTPPIATLYVLRTSVYPRYLHGNRPGTQMIQHTI